MFLNQITKRILIVSLILLASLNSRSQGWSKYHAIAVSTARVEYTYLEIPDDIIETNEAENDVPSSASTYQWQKSLRPLDGFVDIPGETKAMLSFSAPLQQTTYFRRITFNISFTPTQLISNTVKIKIVSKNWEDENYVRVHTILKPGVSDWKTVDDLTIGTEQKLESTTYYDDLGRPIQKVSREVSTPTSGSLLWGDMVGFTEYDQFGRKNKNYLPFTTTSSLGKFKTGVLTAQADYYTLKFNETSAYSEVVDYDNSPLNRSLIVKAPGTAWSAGRPKDVSYEFNLFSDYVRIWDKWSVPSSNLIFSPVSYGVYEPNTLYKTISTDENNKQVIEFTDKDGLLILKKVQLANTPTDAHLDWVCTYYIYDNFGRLRCTLEPKLVKQCAEGDSWDLVDESESVHELAFFYLYDEKGRVIQKKNPGAQPIEMLYDARNRLVFTQDGNQKIKEQWGVTLYDDLDRPTISALYNTPNTRGSMQALIDGATTTVTTNISNPNQIVNNLVVDTRDVSITQYTATNSIEFVPPVTGAFESVLNDNFIAEILPAGATTNYSETFTLYHSPLSNTVLTSNDVTILKYLYYDHYKFPGVQTFDANTNNTEAYPVNGSTVKSIQTSKRTLSFATGSKTRVLNTTVFLTQTVYYDDDGQEIQSIQQNIKNGTDVITNQFHYDGRLLSVSAKHTTVSTGYTNYTILNKYVFDKIGRPVETLKKIGSNAFIKITTAQYNDLGRLSKKVLDPNFLNNTTGTYGLENFVYDYNLHGTLIGINKDYAFKELGFNKWSNYFGLYLGYDNKENKLSSQNLSGQLAGVIWTTQGDDAQRKYEYTYDNVGRLAKAIFNQKKTISDSWNNSQLDFSLKGSGSSGNITYDVNGNLLNMVQRGIIVGSNTPVNIDDLQYLYYEKSNRLKKVTDNSNAASFNGKMGDYSNKHTAPADENLDYDANGNTIKDYNKGIDQYTVGSTTYNGIHYNHLDKPEKIKIDNKGIVQYVYDADGVKLQKIYTPDGATESKVTTYIGIYTYEETKTIATGTAADIGAGGNLKDIAFEEGRIRVIEAINNSNGFDFVVLDGNITLPNNKKGVFEYFVKDHLASVRMVLTRQTHQSSIICTQEEARISNNIEQPIFGQPGTANEVTATRFVVSSIPGQTSGNGWNHAAIGNHVSKLSKLTGNTVGANSLLKVMAGDNITANVQYFYKNTVTNGTGGNLVSNVLGSLVMAISGSTSSVTSAAHGTAVANNISSSLNSSSPFTAITAPHANDATGNNPKAYLTILFFDERFNFVSENSDYRRVNSANNSNATLNISNIKAPKNGYVYIYISNESDEPVYFDNLRVTHVAGHIQEESHYYAYGLKIAGISSRAFTPASPLQRDIERQQYQGDFADFEEELEWNDFALRSYDPQLGRWLQQDPYDEFSSPYVGMGNDPVNLTDPSGGNVFGSLFLGIVGGSLAGTLIDPTGGNGGWWKGAVAGAAIALGVSVDWGATFALNAANVGVSIASFNENQDFISKSLNDKFNNENAKQNNSNTKNQDSFNEDEEWKPLSKNKFKEIYKEDFGFEGDENKWGQRFELFFHLWVLSDPMQSDANIEKNDDKFGGGIRNTVPDFIGDGVLRKYNGNIHTKLRSHWFELKAKANGLYVSSDDKQVISHISNLITKFADDMVYYANFRFKPMLTLITTSDVKYSKSIGNHTNLVKYEHRHAEYRKTKKGYEFRFSKVIGKNF